MVLEKIMMSFSVAFPNIAEDKNYINLCKLLTQEDPSVNELKTSLILVLSKASRYPPFEYIIALWKGSCQLSTSWV